MTLPDGWKKKLLLDVTKVIYSNVDKKSRDGQRAVRLCNYMDVFNNEYITSSLDFMLSTASNQEIKKFSLLKNDVIFTKDSETVEEIASCAVVIDNLDHVVCGYHLGIARPNKDQIYGPYLAKLFASYPLRKEIMRLTNGVTRFGLNLSALSKLSLPLPPLPEQEKIAEILGSVDAAIEATQSVIDQTARTKKALMTQLLTRGLPGRHTKFKPSPLGDIPEGWEHAKLSETEIRIVDGDRGKQYPKQNDFSPNGHCLFLSAKNVTSEGFVFKEMAFITEQKDRELRKGKLQRDDIIITSRGTVGNVAYYDDTISFEHVRINSGMLIIRNKDQRISCDFLHLLFLSDLIQKQLEFGAFGSAQPQITVKIVNELAIPIPNIEEQNKICEIHDAIDQKLKNSCAYLTQLKKLKTALMQALLTGTVRVPAQTTMQHKEVVNG